MTTLITAEKLESKIKDETILTQQEIQTKDPKLTVQQNPSPNKEEILKDNFPLLSSINVKCGGCGKEAVVHEDDAPSHLTESSYICDICKSRAQKKLRLHQLLNGKVPSEELKRVEPKLKHSCPDCGKEFISQTDLQRHANIHRGLKPFSCDTCGKSFTQSGSLKRHLLTHTDVKPHHCKVCGLNFKGHLARHMRTHTGEKPFKCQICQKGFYKSELLKKHLTEHMRDGSVTCSKTQLDDIVQKNHQQTCLICDKTYTSPGHLARHMKQQHNSQNVLRCGVCTEVFSAKEALQEHLQGHSKEDLAAIIAATFANATALTNGMPSAPDEEEAVPDNEEPPMKEQPSPAANTPDNMPSQSAVPEEHACLDDRVTCGICGHACCCSTTYPCLSLQSAVPEEHACLDDRVTCGICGHACCCTNYIPLHMVNHEETMIQCRSCGMDFAPAGVNTTSQICNVCKPEQAESGAGAELQKVEADETDDQDNLHDDLHEDDGFDDGSGKRYQCLQCDKSYKFLKHLKEHARVHAGGYRPYKCNTCGKFFSKRYHLNRHQLIHARVERQQQENQSSSHGAPVRGRMGRPPLYTGMRGRIGRPPIHSTVKGRIGRPPLHTTVRGRIGRPPLYSGMKGRIGRPPLHRVSEERVDRPPAETTVKGRIGRPPLHSVIEGIIDRQPSETLEKATGGRLPMHIVAIKRKVGSPPLLESPPEPTIVQPAVPVQENMYAIPRPLSRHMPFVCCACGKGFPKRVPLKRHLLNHLREGTIPKDHPQLDEMKVNSYVNANVGISPQLQSCPVCGKVCKGLHLQRHMKIHSDDEIKRARDSNQGASPQLQKQQSSPQQRVAIAKPHPGIVYMKDEAPASPDGDDFNEGDLDHFGNDDSMPMSMDNILNLGQQEPEVVKEHECLNDQVNCGICGHSCCCANYITFHMEIHNEESDTCGKCGKELGDLPATRVQGGRICSICTSRSRKQMRLHQILRNKVLPPDSPVSESTPQRLECPQCPKSFVDRRSFREHLRIHSGEKRYHCSFCGMAFSHSRNFKRHIQRHTGEKPNWCHICNKGISGHLARHMRSHSAEKSYVCNMCGKGFNRSEHLKRHLKTHLGSKEQYQCHICAKKFMRKEHLKRHVKSHMDGSLGSGGDATSSEASPVKPVRPPVNDQPYKEHPCTYDVAVCGLCGDVCCCANYIPYHMEVHGEKAEDYIDGRLVKKEVTPMQGGDGGRTVREHSCTFDPVSCGHCGEVCCCANYIPIHMELHGEKPTDFAKDQILKNVREEVQMKVDERIPEEAPESPVEQLKDHSCLGEKVVCGISGETFCCANYIALHMVKQTKQAAETRGQDHPDDILEKALHASEIIGDVKPHPCTHEIVSCGVCGEPCCCPNYIPFHMELHSEILNQETVVQEEVVGITNEEIPMEEEAHEADTTGEIQEVPASVAGEVVEAPEAVEAPRAVTASETAEVVINGGAGARAVVEEHTEEFDWASVANFLQGIPEPDPLPVPPPMATVTNVEPLNGSPVKVEPTQGQVQESRVDDHICLQAQVTCETCGHVLCCINNLIPHLDTHKVMTVQCEVCHQEVEMTRTATVMKDGVKIYKCGACVMGLPTMPSRSSRPAQVRDSEGGPTPSKNIPCPHCPRVLKCRKDYTRHIKIHAEVKPYKCDLCGKEFTAMANLRRHLDAHAGVKAHECKICGQFFSGHMARHMRTHTGEKKYNCEICPKGFNRMEHLKRHLWQHLKDGNAPSDHKQLLELGVTRDNAQPSETSPSKSNWCDICHKIVPGRLARHKMTHSDVKPYQCTQCDKAFYRSEHLKRHLEVHARKAQFTGLMPTEATA
ncbi:uncharacterized protein LOC121417579 [Lytechinus variegatus]|uniref:uncharacterized protein LOC121417579 n=1 Tax=Lytechinus variegatus TaxID=7654 RepID=UPI001BB19960|nr:uncharacterized protein LOC121417579 [Lytechinus variegatus]